MNQRLILFLLFFGLTNSVLFAQPKLEYPASLKNDTLFVPKFEKYPEPSNSSTIKKKDLEKIKRLNKRIDKANEMLQRVLETNYPYTFQLIDLEEEKSLHEGNLVLSSFSQDNRKMIHYYRENPELLDELLNDEILQTSRFKDVYVYYFIAELAKPNEQPMDYIYVDFGKKNIPQALRYFCQSVVAYFSE